MVQIWPICKTSRRAGVSADSRGPRFNLPVVLIGRLCSDRVFHAPATGRRGPTKGRPPRHGARLVLANGGTHSVPDLATVNDTARYGHAKAIAFTRMHPRLASRGGWATHEGALPIIEGTLVCLTVERLPGDRDPKPIWLWSSKPARKREETVSAGRRLRWSARGRSRGGRWSRSPTVAGQRAGTFREGWDSGRD